MNIKDTLLSPFIWDQHERLDALEDVPLDGAAVEDGVIGNPETTLFAVIVESSGHEILDFGWEVGILGACEVCKPALVVFDKVLPL